MALVKTAALITLDAEGRIAQVEWAHAEDDAPDLGFAGPVAIDEERLDEIARDYYAEPA
jgi:hypothetical protein